MTHEYSIQIHEWISKKKGSIQKEIKKSDASNNTEKEAYFNGQLLEIKRIRKYLTENIDLTTQTYFN